MHAAPDAPDVDVLLDDAEVVSDVPYLEASAYLDVPAGGHEVKINAAGTTTTLIDADVTVVDATDAEATGGGAPLDLVVLVDVN